MTLTEFLEREIAADEAAARAATPGPWRWEEPSDDEFPNGDQSLVSDASSGGGCVLYGWGYDASGISATDGDREHIARHDPARVLAECDAKRRIVASHVHAEAVTYRDDSSSFRYMDCDVCCEAWQYAERGGWCLTLRALAQPYADRPGFDPAWKLDA